MIRLVLLSSLVLRAVRPASSIATTATTAMALQAMDFEVYGRVQGVFFRKFTKEQADKLGLRGWCKNTHQGTVLGYMEGETDKVQSMVNWLNKTGSPSSQIDKAEFRNQKDITTYGFDGFAILKD